MSYDRKLVKAAARRHVKRHYVLLIVLCAVSIFLGTEFAGVVSNITQTAVTIPLHASEREAETPRDVLAFTNRGRAPVMLRPRQDVELLVPADAFGWNLLRACVVMTCALAAVIAFGVFLGAVLPFALAVEGGHGRARE